MTTWDQNGNVITAPTGQKWDENGKPINLSPADAVLAGQKPNAVAPTPNAIDDDALAELKREGIKYPGPNFKPSWAPEGMSPSQYLAKLKSGTSLELPAQMLGGQAAAGIGAGITGVAGLAARAAAAGAGQGVGELAAGGAPSQAGAAAATGAIAQPIAEGVTAAAQSIAPKLAESALNITDRMRGRGRTIGDAVLEHTTGVTPSALAGETKQAIGKIVGQMEDAVDQATQTGVTGSAQPAKNVLDDAISNLPRNARSLQTKLAGLNDLLDLGQGQQANYTPSELLEMKRGIGKEISTWGPEWQKMPDVKAVQSRMYGAIDGELDRLVPGNSELNQIISSLTPAKQQAARISGGATIGQRMAARLKAPTGALLTGVVGGGAGYKEGGIPGAIAGAAAGMAVPEIVGSPTSQMVAARLINAIGDKIQGPQLLPIIKAIIGSQDSKESQ